MSIKLSNIYHTYSKGTPFERLALNDVSLEISKGEIVAIIGQSLPERVAIEYYDGTIKMRESSEDPWGSKYEMKPIIKDNQLRGFEIVSDNINIQVVE